jgi:hypothetical protein
MGFPSAHKKTDQAQLHRRAPAGKPETSTGAFPFSPTVAVARRPPYSRRRRYASVGGCGFFLPDPPLTRNALWKTPSAKFLSCGCGVERCKGLTVWVMAWSGEHPTVHRCATCHSGVNGRGGPSAHPVAQQSPALLASIALRRSHLPTDRYDRRYRRRAAHMALRGAEHPLPIVAGRRPGRSSSADPLTPRAQAYNPIGHIAGATGVLQRLPGIVGMAPRASPARAPARSSRP